MKAITKILFFIVLLFASVSCSEDIYLHGGEDGQNGLNGLNGQNGQNGLSTLLYFDELTQTKIYYLDRDTTWSFTYKDTILYEEPREGVRVTQEGECIRITEINGTEETSYLVCDGDDGTNGTNGEDGQDGEDGTNGTNGQDGTNGTDGQDGEPGQTIYVYLPFTDNFNNGESHNYVERDYVLDNTTLSVNPYDRYYHVSPNGNGRLVKWEYNREQNPDSLMWFPELTEPTAIDYFSLDIGSKKEWEVKMFFQRLDGTVVFIQSETTIPNDAFVWYLTYTQKFVYQVDISEIEYQDVVRVGLLVTKVNDDPISDSDWENETISMDNVYIHRVKVIE